MRRGGERGAAFDHEKLAASLSKAAETTYEANRLPFNRIEFTDGAKSVRFVAGESQWECNLERTSARKSARRPKTDNDDDEQGDGRGNRRGRRFGRGGDRRGAGGGPSPDGKWNAFVRDNNVYVRASRQRRRKHRKQRTARRRISTQHGRHRRSPLRNAAVGARFQNARRIPHRTGRPQGSLSRRVVALRRRPGELCAAGHTTCPATSSRPTS